MAEQQQIITLSNYQHHLTDDHTPCEDEHMCLSSQCPEEQCWQSPLASPNAQQSFSAGGLHESLKHCRFCS